MRIVSFLSIPSDSYISFIPFHCSTLLQVSARNRLSLRGKFLVWSLFLFFCSLVWNAWVIFFLIPEDVKTIRIRHFKDKKNHTKCGLYVCGGQEVLTFPWTHTHLLTPPHKQNKLQEYVFEKDLGFKIIPNMSPQSHLKKVVVKKTNCLLEYIFYCTEVHG